MNNSFIKWAGGKTWLLNLRQDIFPSEYNQYFEPFIGGGSVFFHLQPQRAILSDVNEELIETYTALRDEAELVIHQLEIHQHNNSKEYYYRIRDYEPRTPVEKAARMIYLNKTCFNGIYRVNKAGKFNVPYGTERELNFDKEKLRRCSELLMNANIYCQDFQETIDLSQNGDFIFCDPPYAVIDENNRFIGYNAEQFKWEDQERLAMSLLQAKNRGVLIMMTNVDHPRVRRLYEQDRGFQLQTAERMCIISGKREGRKRYKELIVTANY